MKVRQPQASIWLYKPRSRQALGGSYTAADRFRAVQQIDITKFLSDSGFRTTCGLGDPNGGNFQIVFDDKPVPNFGDSLYGLIEPMDFIEIRGTGLAQSQQLPILLRGFVGNVGEDYDIDGGSPARRVVVSGYGIGRALQLLRIRYSAAGVSVDEANQLTQQYGIPFGEPSLAAFGPLTQWTGSAGTLLQPAQFVDGVVQQVINPYLAKLFGDTPALSALTSTSSECSITNGVVPPLQGTGAFDGRSVYEVLADVLDVGPFNELYLDDRDSNIVLVSRQLPWLDTSGSPIGGAKTADELSISLDDLIGGSATRDDTGVANYFWVQRPGDLITDNQRRLAGATGDSGTYLLQEENSNPTAFGWRFMEVPTHMTNDAAAIMSPTADGNQPRTQSEVEWLTARRQLLIDLNRDNVVFERGSLKLRGNENVRRGMYLLLTRGSTVVRVYVTSVSHQFGQAGGFITQVQYVRGTGWLERASSPGLPWYSWRDERGVT